jgi:hypothetical protein
MEVSKIILGILTIVFLAILLWLSTVIFLRIRSFLETRYDEIHQILLSIFSIFLVVQIILGILIYFDILDKNIFYRVLPYNLIWAVPLGLFHIIVRERCPDCSSFETQVTSETLHREYVTYNSYQDTESINRCLEKIRFTCHNCDYEHYTYEIQEDGKTKEVLSEQEAIQYLKDKDSSLTDIAIGLLLGGVFLS